MSRLALHAQHTSQVPHPSPTLHSPRTPHSPRTRLVALATMLAVALSLAASAPGVLGGDAGLLRLTVATASPSGAPQVAASSAGDAQANPSATVPSASTVSGDEFLAALPAPTEADAKAGYVVLDGNEPSFSAADAITIAFESYAPLDELGRCGTAYACLGEETMPTERRGDISEVRPSGWAQGSYPFVQGESLYNRSHLIAFSLAGEGANERNLVTGTERMNQESMEPLEEMVLDYIRQTGNHVLYRVTPVFAGRELVARGVQMEARSMEDGGAGVTLNVFVYNAQPGVVIDYATGENHAADVTPANPHEESVAAEEAAVSASAGKPVAGATGAAAAAGTSNTEPARSGVAQGGVAQGGTASDASTQAGLAGGAAPVLEAPTDDAAAQDYVLNTNTKKFHYPWCSAVKKMSAKNREDVHETRDEAIAQGYDPCKICNP